MGFLGIATPLSWEDSKKYLKYVREHGVDQFVSIYERLKVYFTPLQRVHTATTIFVPAYSDCAVIVLAG